MPTENTEMFVTYFDDQGFKTFEEAEQACIDLLQIHEKTNVTYEIFFVYGEYLPYWETVNKA
jgi:hypothetical protein